jgi:hypothetical protein
VIAEQVRRNRVVPPREAQTRAAVAEAVLKARQEMEWAVQHPGQPLFTPESSSQMSAALEQQGPTALHQARAHIAQPAVGQSFQPGLGAQLSSRVSSGEITQDQAQRTAHERAQLGSTYGPLWRQKVYGGVNLPKLRTTLAQGGSGTAYDHNQLVYNRLMQRRKNMLTRAKANGGTTAGGS